MKFFYYMIFTRYSAGKIWSSICTKDLLKAELHYQINLIQLNNIITRFLYQNFLTDKSDGDNSLEHRGVLRKMELFVNIVTDKKLLTIFTKSSTLDL